MKLWSSSLVAASLFFALSGLGSVSVAADADAAKDLLKDNKCTKCHHTSRKKSGPSLKAIAEKYKGKADAEQTLIKAMTSAPMIKLEDGSEEEHAIIDTKDEGMLKNVAQYILAQ